MKVRTLCVLFACVLGLANCSQRFIENNDFCYSICKGYKDICMPEFLDPTDLYSPHCEHQLNILKRPTQWCISCIQSHGLTPKSQRPTSVRYPQVKTTRKYNTKLPNTSPGLQPNPVSSTPQSPLSRPIPGINTDLCRTSKFGCVYEKCLEKCGGSYEGLCVPRWIDIKDEFSPHCEDTGGVGMPQKGCLLCLKVNGAITNPQPTHNPTITPTKPTVTEIVDDPCRQRCLNYEDICLPEYIDPFDLFYPHCDDEINSVLPPIACLHCLKTFAVTPTPAPRPSLPTHTTRTSTTDRGCEGRDCEDDPCLKKCGNYNSLCFPEQLDPDNIFFPHCQQTGGVGMPTQACVKCIKLNGLTSTTLSLMTAKNTKTTSQTALSESLGTSDEESLENTLPFVIEAPEIEQVPVKESSQKTMAKPVAGLAAESTLEPVAESTLQPVAESTLRHEAESTLKRVADAMRGTKPKRVTKAAFKPTAARRWRRFQ